MNIQLSEGEKIVKEGAANHFKGVESVGGKLFLTNFRLYFKSHAFNVQVHELSIPLDEIKSVELKNTLGIVPNGMAVTLKDGHEERYVVYGRGDWKRKILSSQASAKSK